MTELERVYDAEIIGDKPSLEDIKAEWTMGAERKLHRVKKCCKSIDFGSETCNDSGVNKCGPAGARPSNAPGPGHQNGADASA